MPVQSSEETSIAAEEDKVTVTLRAETVAGFTLQCDSVTMTREQLRAYGGKIPKIDGKFDFPGITAALKKIKGISQVTKKDQEKKNIYGYSIQIEKGADVRNEIFKMAVEKDFQLYELTPEKVSLENVFIELTKFLY